MDLTDKNNLKDPKENMALANLSIYYTRKNIKSEYDNNRFKTSALTWNDSFDLRGRYYSISEIQDYTKFFIKKHETFNTVNTEFSSVEVWFTDQASKVLDIEYY